MRGTHKDGNLPPYYEVIRPLVASTMRAQGELLRARIANPTAVDIPDSLINAHFAWLTQDFREGINRHLFDSTEANFPLRKHLLRQRKKLPEPIREILRSRSSLPISSENNDF